MRKIFAFLTMLVALVAVTVPSAAVSSRGFVDHPAPLLLLEADGHYVRGPCIMGGAGRALVCRPDIGVLPMAVFSSPPPAEPFAVSLIDLVPPNRILPPGLPPPRLA